MADRDGKDVVAYLGPPASYTHQAAQKAFSASRNHTLVPQPTIAALFSAIESRSAALAVCPIENSSNGPVGTTLDLFADPMQQNPNVRVVGEVQVPVRHCLLVSSSAAGVPRGPQVEASGALFVPRPKIKTVSFEDAQDDEHIKQQLSDLGTLYTHPQAWGQCTRFLDWLDKLRSTQPGATRVRRVDTTSTSNAAAIVAGVEPPPGTSDPARAPASTIATPFAAASNVRLNAITEAAISSEATLALYPDRLTLLLSGLEDSPDNVTRFVVLAHADSLADALLHNTTDTKQKALLTPTDSLVGDPSQSTTAAKQKALLTFTLTKDASAKAPPGALAASLAVFARHHLDLTSIAARPSARGPWDYVFVVEVELPAAEPQDDRARGRQAETQQPELAVANSQDNQALEDGEQAIPNSKDNQALIEAALRHVRAVAGEARCVGVWRFDQDADADAENQDTKTQ